jgi:hypothetical protein
VEKTYRVIWHCNYCHNYTGEDKGAVQDSPTEKVGWCIRCFHNTPQSGWLEEEYGQPEMPRD